MSLDLKTGSSSKLYTVKRTISFVSYGTNVYLDDFTGIFQNDYATESYVVEKFNGEKKVILKGGYLKAYSFKEGKIGLTWIDEGRKLFYTEADKAGNIILTADLGLTSYYGL